MPSGENIFPGWLHSGQVSVLDRTQCIEAETKYRKISNIRRTKSQNLNVSRLVLQLSLSNPMKPGVKSRMKM